MTAVSLSQSEELLENMSEGTNRAAGDRTSGRLMRPSWIQHDKQLGGALTLHALSV